MRFDMTYKENPTEYRRRQSLVRREKEPIRYLYNQAKYRAKLRGIEFNLNLSDLEIPTRCPVFGIPLFFTAGRRSGNSFSLDRWDNSKGYTKENTRVISWRANQYKGDLTIEEVRGLLKYMEGNS